VFEEAFADMVLRTCLAGCYVLPLVLASCCNRLYSLNIVTAVLLPLAFTLFFRTVKFDTPLSKELAAARQRSKTTTKNLALARNARQLFLFPFGETDSAKQVLQHLAELSSASPVPPNRVQRFSQACEDATSLPLVLSELIVGYAATDQLRTHHFQMEASPSRSAQA
jgi:hypothetical protein